MVDTEKGSILKKFLLFIQQTFQFNALMNIYASRLIIFHQIKFNYFTSDQFSGNKFQVRGKVHPSGHLSPLDAGKRISESFSKIL
ncbi:hypothetical protein BpHYR1_013212 [Brachionus plicatilis]|uniref:Uncharacterized protein n=1 Tax=Brachionus plicatilis TaxID=10195 RepID=A0A3M7QK62_BRAPC|nr:hypothetical protein BpHYR1_013212 [Brachionus plicatilis]